MRLQVLGLAFLAAVGKLPTDTFRLPTDTAFDLLVNLAEATRLALLHSEITQRPPTSWSSPPSAIYIFGAL